MSSLILLRLVPFYNLYQRYTLLYVPLSVLRKVAAGTYIGGYLFYISFRMVTEMEPLLSHWIFLH